MFVITKCAPPLVVASNIDEKTLKKDGVCAASLPTTMGIVAGFLVQNTLKYLLEFGSVSHYLGYNALEDFFPKYSMKPNPNCDDSFCVKQQKTYALLQESKPIEPVALPQQEAIVHEDNDWGISVVDESTDVEENLHVAQGLQLSYNVNQAKQPDNESNTPAGDSNITLDELMKQMKSL